MTSISPFTAQPLAQARDPFGLTDLIEDVVTSSVSNAFEQQQPLIRTTIGQAIADQTPALEDALTGALEKSLPDLRGEFVAAIDEVQPQLRETLNQVIDDQKPQLTAIADGYIDRLKVEVPVLVDEMVAEQRGKIEADLRDLAETQSAAIKDTVATIVNGGVKGAAIAGGAGALVLVRGPAARAHRDDDGRARPHADRSVAKNRVSLDDVA